MGNFLFKTRESSKLSENYIFMKFIIAVDESALEVATKQEQQPEKVNSAAYLLECTTPNSYANVRLDMREPHISLC